MFEKLVVFKLKFIFKRFKEDKERKAKRFDFE